MSLCQYFSLCRIICKTTANLTLDTQCNHAWTQITFPYFGHHVAIYIYCVEGGSIKSLFANGFNSQTAIVTFRNKMSSSLLPFGIGCMQKAPSAEVRVLSQGWRSRQGGKTPQQTQDFTSLASMCGSFTLNNDNKILLWS